MGTLIIDPALLADIRAQCQRRAAELAAAPSTLTTVPEPFAAAVQTMPAPVRAFFEGDQEPYIPVHRRESALDQEQRQLRESIGGWCG
jgi:hypothetical protein